MVKGLYTQKISSVYDKWFWNYDIFNFEQSLSTPKILNLQLFLPIFILFLLRFNWYRQKSILYLSLPIYILIST